TSVAMGSTAFHHAVRDAFDRGSHSRRLAYLGAVATSRPRAGRTRFKQAQFRQYRQPRIWCHVEADSSFAVRRGGSSGGPTRGSHNVNTDLKENVISTASRPEFECIPTDAISIGDVERPLSFVERLGNSESVQRLAILLVLIIVWEL